MEVVENFSDSDLVIVGFGARGQEGALRTAGAEKVLTYPDDLGMLFRMAGLALRPHDVLLMVQPGILSEKDYRTLYKACDGELMFQVVGHEPFPLSKYKHFKEFRKIKPKGVGTEVVQITGRPRTIDYTVEQAEAIIRLWHQATPRLKPAEVCEEAKKVLKLADDYELKPHWIRDLVIKYVGTAKREKPDAWNGIQANE